MTCIVLAVVAAALLSAFSPQEPGGRSAVARFSVRDSAGVTLVENDLRQPTADDWTVSAEPVLRIGSDAADSYIFVQVAAAARLRDGRIVVADRRLSQIRLFDASGRFLKQIGRQGDGPGEFRRLSSMFVLPSDSIVMNDQSGTLLVYTPRGDYARQLRATPFQIPSADGPRTLGLAGVFGDGALLVSAGSSLGGKDPVGTVERDSATTIGARANWRGQVVARYPEMVTSRSIRFEPNEGMTYVYTKLLPQAPLVPLRTLLVHADPATATLRYYNDAGRLVRSAHLTLPTVPVGPKLAERYYANVNTPAAIPLPEARGARPVPPLPIPKVAPAWDHAMADGDGNLWLRTYIPGPDPAPRRWLVLDTLGVVRHAARAFGPDGVTQIRDGYQVAVAYGDDLTAIEVRSVRPSRPR